MGYDEPEILRSVHPVKCPPIADGGQVFANLPIVEEHGHTGIGDVEFGLDYALLKDTGALNPEVTLGFLAAAPTGDADDHLGVGGWSYMVSLRASKQLGYGVYGHILGEYEWTPNGGSDFDALTGWSFGAGASWRVAEPVTLIAEYIRKQEREEIHGIVHTGVESFVSAGVSYEFADHFFIGAAGAFGVNDHTDENRIIVNLEKEF